MKLSNATQTQAHLQTQHHVTIMSSWYVTRDVIVTHDVLVWVGSRSTNSSFCDTWPMTLLCCMTNWSNMISTNSRSNLMESRLRLWLGYEFGLGLGCGFEFVISLGLWHRKFVCIMTNWSNETQTRTQTQARARDKFPIRVHGPQAYGWAWVFQKIQLSSYIFNSSRNLRTRKKFIIKYFLFKFLAKNAIL